MKRCPFALLFIALAVVASTAAAGNWPQWRGPSGQGYADDTQIPLTWSDTENLLWKFTLPGQGNSSPIVWGDRVFVTAASADGNERFVVCVRASDGKQLWQQTAFKGMPGGRTHKWNGFASASCTTDGTHVYAFFGTPGLFCYDLDGKLIWKHEFGTFTTTNGWGNGGASPFLFEDLVIQNCDNDGPAGLRADQQGEQPAPMALIALDKLTGKERWRTERNQGKGWSTPVLIPMPNGRTDLVLNGPFGVWGYDPRTGKEIWHCERHKGEEQALFGEPVPAFNQEFLFGASGRTGPMQAIQLGGTGDVTKSHVRWEVARKARDVASPILSKGLLFLMDCRSANLACYDPKDGKLLFKERVGASTYTASPVEVRGKLLFVMDDGLTLVVEPGPKLNVIGRNRLTDTSEFRASPAIAAGRLVLRSQTHLYCIGEKK
jgi:outer membrane protein assembly factor BamB